MEHHFNVQVAQQFGVEEAVIIHNLFHWISKNAANDENMFEGLYWTYNSIKAYSALFPYLSETKVKRVFKSLEEKGVIVKGNFSDDKWVRTNWYSFPLDTLNYLKNVGYDVHWVKMTESIGSKCTNGEVQNDQMILINNTDSKPYSKEKEILKEKTDDDVFVDNIYAMYPAKCPVRNTYLGKCSKDKDRIRKLLKTYSKEDIEKVVTHEVDEKFGKSMMQNFSTFLNNFPDPNELSNSGEYPRDIEDVKDEDNMPALMYFIPWVERRCGRIWENLRNLPKTEETYRRLAEHTVGGTKGLCYVTMVLDRDGWDKYDDGRGFLFVYSNYIKANGMYVE